MTDDLVARLRACDGRDVPLWDEAADEIERLRRERDKALSKAHEWAVAAAQALQASLKLTRENEKLRAEIAKKDAALDRVRGDINWMLNNRKFLNAECFDYHDALTPAAQEAPYDPTTQPYDEPFSHVDRPASPSPGLRDAVIEECAKVLEATILDERSMHCCCDLVANTQRREDAARIRALASDKEAT